eukprot:403360060
MSQSDSNGKISRRKLDIKITLSQDQKLERLYDIEQEWLERNSNKNDFSMSNNKIRVPSSPLIPYSEPIIEVPSYLLLKTSQSTINSPQKNSFQRETNNEMQKEPTKQNKKRKFSELQKPQSSCNLAKEEQVYSLNRNTLSLGPRKYMHIKSRYSENLLQYKKHCCLTENQLLPHYSKNSQTTLNYSGNYSKRLCTNNRSSTNLKNKQVLQDLSNLQNLDKRGYNITINPISCSSSKVGSKRFRCQVDQDENSRSQYRDLSTQRSTNCVSTQASKRRKLNDRKSVAKREVTPFSLTESSMFSNSDNQSSSQMEGVFQQVHSNENHLQVTFGNITRIRC